MPVSPASTLRSSLLHPGALQALCNGLRFQDLRRYVRVRTRSSSIWRRRWTHLNRCQYLYTLRELLTRGSMANSLQVKSYVAFVNAIEMDTFVLREEGSKS
uniref:Uncharacterized protein n=1 Tax=Hyaloperonospora arabidopsidis (strain Emoy2) TaxID=559515 RepID=M4BK52_HYAAE